MPNDPKTERAKLLKKGKSKRTAQDFARIAELERQIAELSAENPSRASDQAIVELREDQAELIAQAAIDTVAAMSDEEVKELVEEARDATTVTTIKRATIQSDCETAHEDGCTCRCRGKYHGQPHPKGWKDEEGCEPLNKTEKKLAKKEALYAWRRKNPERVSSYMKQWREDKKNAEASEEAEEKGEGGE